MNLTELSILILATWRITNLIVDMDEGGPWNVLDWARYQLGVRYDSSKNMSYGTNVVSNALTCFWCTSFWVGVVCTGLTFLPNKIGYFVLLPFALSGGALVVKKWVKK